MYIYSNIKCENSQFVLSEDNHHDILQCVDTCVILFAELRIVLLHRQNLVYSFANCTEFHLSLFEGYYSCIY